MGGKQKKDDPARRAGEKNGPAPERRNILNVSPLCRDLPAVSNKLKVTMFWWV